MKSFLLFLWYILFALWLFAVSYIPLDRIQLVLLIHTLLLCYFREKICFNFGMWKRTNEK